jgi:hypothetical protein
MFINVLYVVSREAAAEVVGEFYGIKYTDSIERSLKEG